MTNDAGEPNPDDAVLLAAAGRGDHDAFGHLFDRHVRAVFWQAHGILRDPDDAQDAAQEAFCLLWSRRHAVRVVDESVLPWLMVTARNLALNAHRKTRRHANLSLIEGTADDPRPGPETQVETKSLHEEVNAALAQLSPLDRALFDACISGDLSYDQAATQLGVSHGTVRNRLSRLRTRLRNDLSNIREES